MELLDKAEEIRDAILEGHFESDKWDLCINDFSEPAEQLEALRQAFVQERWSAAIKKHIHDDMDRMDYMDDGKFNYKAPLAEIQAGRSRA